MSPTKIERFDLDAQGKKCSEGYYVMTPTGLILVPPTGGLKKGFRFATQLEVDAGKARPAALEEIEIPADAIAVSP